MTEHVLRLCRFKKGVDSSVTPAMASLKHLAILPVAQIDGFEHVQSMDDILCLSDSDLDRLEFVMETFDSDPESLTSYSLSEIQLEAPIERPLHIRAALAFENHLINVTRKVGMGPILRKVDQSIESIFGRRRSLAAKANAAFYQQPPYYKASVSCITGPVGQVVRPSYAADLDYEVELGCVLGRKLESSLATEAENAIFGYVMFNDFSVRDQQFREMRARLGPSKGKDFTNSNAFGPFLIPKRYINDPYNLTFQISKNGIRINDPTISGVYWRFGDILAHISQNEPLYPGEIFLLGCCGEGSGLEMDVRLGARDIVSISHTLFGEMSHEVL